MPAVPTDPPVMPSGNRVFGGLARRVGTSIAFQNPFHVVDRELPDSHAPGNETARRTDSSTELEDPRWEVPTEDQWVLTLAHAFPLKPPRTSPVEDHIGGGTIQGESWR